MCDTFLLQIPCHALDPKMFEQRMAIIWFIVYSLQNAHLLFSASERKHWQTNFTSYLCGLSGSFLGSSGISEVEDRHKKKASLPPPLNT